MKKPNRPAISKVKDLADDIYSIDRRIECAIATTWSRDMCECITCKKIYPTFWMWNTQLWHFVLRWVLQLRYKRENTHWQCFHCNSTYMNGKKWEQYRHWKAIDLLYGIWTAEELMKIEDGRKIDLALRSQMKPWDYIDVILESYKNIEGYREKYNIELPKSCEDTIRKCKKLLDSITRDEKYLLQNQ